MQPNNEFNEKEYQTAQRLLLNSGALDEAEGEQPQGITEPDIIPPVGIADPKLLESYLQNPEDEEKIRRDIKILEDYHRENAIDTLHREGVSYGARALEGLGGTLSGMLNALSGEAYFDDSGELVKNEVPMLPSAQKLRQFTKEKTGERLEPKGPVSKELHEAATDIGASLPLPGGWAQKLLLPVLGQGVSKLVRNQGGSEAQGDLAKSAFLMSATLANIGNAPQFARNAYAAARNMVPQGTRMSTRYLTQELNALQQQPWYRTGRTTSKGPAFDEIERIERAIQHGSMDVQEAMQIRQDINEARKKLGAFNYEPGIDKAAARQYLDRVDDVLRNNLERWGQSNNPDWLRAYRSSSQAYAVTQRSRQLQDFIQSNVLTKPLQSQTAKTLFHLGGASAIAQAPAALGAAIPVAASAKGIQVINRMIRSPALRNYYTQVLVHASAQNAGAMNRALQKFDEEALKFEKQKSSNRQ